LKFIAQYLAPAFIPAVGVGEGVLDGKIWTSRLPTDHPFYNKPYGYRKIKSGPDYLVDIDKIYKDCYNSSQIAFNLLFAWAPNHPHWNSYDVSVMNSLLADYLKANPPQYWEEQQVSDDLIQAIDVSAWGGQIKDEQWKAAYDAGFRLVTVQAWGSIPGGRGKNKHCQQQLAGARKAGMMTAVYFHLPSDMTTQTHLFIPVVKQAAGTEYEHIRFVVVDIEGSAPLHPTDPVARLKDAISNIQDKSVVIYTSRHMWNDVVMGGAYNVGFEKYPLWDALYDKKAELDTGWVPYGGWKQRAIKQYTGTTTIAGNISADLNIASMKRLLGNTIPDDDDVEMLKQKIEQLEAEGEIKNATIQEQIEIMTAARNTLNTALDS